MLNKIKTFLRNLTTDNEHQKQMKEIEKHYEKIMQEIIDLEIIIEKNNNNILEFLKEQKK